MNDTEPIVDALDDYLLTTAAIRPGGGIGPPLSDLAEAVAATVRATIPVARRAAVTWTWRSQHRDALRRLERN
jgi:hypothetical protein